MTFHEYVLPLRKTRLLGKSQLSIGQELFRKAGAYDEITESAVNSWLYSQRTCDALKHFPEGTINKRQLFLYFKDHTGEPGSWKKIQQAFLSQKPDDPLPENYLIDLETDDRDIFIRSLADQFSWVIGLPQTEWIDEKSAAPVTAASKKELSPEELHCIFLQLADEFKIMDVINRKPPTFNRIDSACFNLFARQIASQIDICYAHKNLLYIFINSFYEQLQLQAFSLERGLNKEIGCDNNDTSVYINMDNGEAIKIDIEEGNLDKAGDDEVDEIKIDDEDDAYDDGEEDDGDDYDDDINWDLLYIPELNEELIKQAADKLRLEAIYFEEWDDFCEKMNILYNFISSWQDKT